MKFKLLLSIAFKEFRMQLRRKYILILIPMILLPIFILVSPYNLDGMIFSEKLAPHSLKLAMLFTSILIGFSVSDRFLRDEFLRMREIIMTKPMGAKEYVIGKLLGNTLYCFILFILPIFFIVQIEQIYFAGTEYYSFSSFIKIYAFSPIYIFFIVSIALYLSTVLKDNTKFFVIFAFFWGLIFFIATSHYGLLSRIIDFTGGMGERIFFPDEFYPLNLRDYLIFFLNIIFLTGCGFLSAVFLIKYLDRESSILGTNEKKKKANFLKWTQYSKSLISYNKDILKWDSQKGVIALAIVFSAMFFRGVRNNIDIIHFYFEALLPLMFSFTTTHIIKADKDRKVLEIILSKPVSKIQLLSKRYFLLLTPNIFFLVIFALVFSRIYSDLNLPILLLVSLSTLLFLCTLSMTAGLLTKASQFGAAVSMLWFLFWINPDIQEKIGSQGLLGIINPFILTYHSLSPLLFLNKLNLLILSIIMFFTSVIILNKSERFI